MIENVDLAKASGRRLAAARAKAGFATQREFAAALGISEPAVAKYEQGKREIPLSVLSWMSDRGVSADFIVTGKGPMLVVEAKSTRSSGAMVKEFLSRADRVLERDAQAPSQVSEPSTPLQRDAYAFDIALLQRLGDLVELICREAGQTPARRTVTAEAGRLYNELLRMAKDITDSDVVEAMLPILQQRFRERILAHPPGTAKVSESRS